LIAPERFERYESNEAFFDLPDTDTEVFVFGGRPDTIELTARVADALVTLTDRIGRGAHELIVLAGTTLETKISRERVVARERAAAGGSQLFVVGKWAQPTSLT
jgi:hypothetical protein